MTAALGVDRVSLAFPLLDWERDPEAWSMGTTHRPGTEPSTTTATTVAVGATTAYVGTMEGAGRPVPWGKVEFNPARVVDPEGVGLCELADLHDCVMDVVGELGELVTPALPVAEWRTKRLDVARDFQGVADPAFYIRGLASSRRKWARVVSVHQDAAKGAAETLRVGSKAGMVRLYDKHEESPTKTQPGHLRWELEARSAWLGRIGAIETMSDVTESTVRQLAADRWQWSEMGAEITATDRLIGRLQAAGHRPTCERGCDDHLSPAEQRGLYGFLVFQARGWNTQASRTTLAKYSRFARQLGLAVDTAEGEADVTGRLDWDSGSEVLAAVA